MTTSHLISIAGIAMSLLAGSGHHEGSANARAEEPQRPDASGNYATVNGLRMYYETRGEGEPLVLLHGAFGLAMDLPALAKNRRVIAVELQGHGHTIVSYRLFNPVHLRRRQMKSVLFAMIDNDRARFAGRRRDFVNGAPALGVRQLQYPLRDRSFSWR